MLLTEAELSSAVHKEPMEDSVGVTKEMSADGDKDDMNIDEHINHAKDDLIETLLGILEKN